MLKLMYKINKIFNTLNKYIYLLPLFTLLSKLFTSTNNKTLKIINRIIKIFIIINLVLGVSIILYLTDFSTPINSTYSIYYDLIEPYIELIKQLWTKLINNFNNLPDSTSISKNELESLIKDTSSQLKSEVKSGIKEGVKEIVDELLNENQLQSEANVPSEANSDLLRQLALYSSVLFFGYFFFVLPSNPEALTEYNWVNQSLIELKFTFKEFILYLVSNPDNPGNPGAPGNNGVVDSPISPGNLNAGLDTYFPLQTTNSVSSEGLSTVTPNTPRVPNITVSEAVSVGTQTVMTDILSKQTQTSLDGRTVSKAVEVINILGDVLPEESTILILDSVNKNIIKITD